MTIWADRPVSGDPPGDQFPATREDAQSRFPSERVLSPKTRPIGLYPMTRDCGRCRETRRYVRYRPRHPFGLFQV